MNFFVVKQLVLKDWRLFKFPIMTYTFFGLLSSSLFLVDNSTSVAIACILLFSILILVGVHLVFASIINERKNQTLVFIMTLPVSIKEYTASKLIINIGFFSFSWGILLCGGLFMIYSTNTIPNGILPMVVLTAIHIIMTFVICIGIALITESEVMTNFAVTVGNLVTTPIMLLIANTPEIQQVISGQEVIWTQLVWTILAVQCLIICSSILITSKIQSRKTDFT